MSVAVFAENNLIVKLSILERINHISNKKKKRWVCEVTKFTEYPLWFLFNLKEKI
jgi:hypothetical protein